MTRRHYFQLIFLVGCLLRLLCLGDRPLHNDEAIHAIYSYDWFTMPSAKFYRYDPHFHGPFLYEMVRWFFALFGVGVTQARLVSAISGSLVFLSPLLFRRWLGNTAALFAIGLLAVSPLQTYSSRFLAPDTLVLFFATLSLYGFLRYRENFKGRQTGNKWLALAGFAAGVVFSTDAIAFLYAFVFITFGLLWWGSDRWERRDWRRPSLRAIKGSGQAVLIIAASLLFSYALFQTSFFQNGRAFAEGLYGEVFTRWWSQSGMERSNPSVNYHLQSLALNELPLFVGITLGWLICFRRSRSCRISFLLVLIAAFLLLPLSKEVSPRPGLFSLLSVRSYADFFPYLFAIGLGAPATLVAIKKRNWPLALAAYWTFVSIAVFSLLNEKVAGQTVHIVLPASLFCGYVFSYLFKLVTDGKSRRMHWARRAVVCSFVFFGLFQARLAYYLSFVTAGEPFDLLSEAQTHRNVKEVVEWIKRYSIEKGLPNRSIRIGLLGKVPTWSYLFYLVTDRFQNVVLTPNELNGSESFVIANEENARKVGPALSKKGYRISELTNRSTWVAERTAMNFAQWFDFSETRVSDGQYTGEPMFVYYRP